MNTAPPPQLQVFLAVARLRSFSGAAREFGVSPSAVSQAMRQLEAQLRVVLLTRTTRSVSLTDAGRRLVEGAGPALGQALAALTEAAAQPGEVVGRVRLTVPRVAVPFVIAPVVPAFRARHPRVEVEVAVEDRFVDIVAEGYDAGVRLSEAIERDMVQVRLTEPGRFVVVGAPAYLERHGTPQRPEELLRHECLTFRSQTTGALYAWELERGRRNWRVPVRGGVVTNDGALSVSFAEQGNGAGVRVRSDGGGAAPEWAAAAGAGGVRGERAGLLPILPQRGAALGAASALRRGREGAGREEGDAARGARVTIAPRRHARPPAALPETQLPAPARGGRKRFRSVAHRGPAARARSKEETQKQEAKAEGAKGAEAKKDEARSGEETAKAADPM